MRERSSNNRDNRKTSAEWQKELLDDAIEELRELRATQNNKEGERSQRFALDHDRRERQQRRLNPDLDDLE